jgi:glycosyltransferase involved in cell wall biosynthesis
MSDTSYILITAARNEADHIGLTIRSVVAQTQLPNRWLIVSDGSTDDTDRIVSEAAKQYPFIELLRVDAESDRNFGSKAAAINAGYQKLASLPHNFIGVLDADVSFDPDYYEQVLARFQAFPTLGISGGVLIDIIDGVAVRQQTDPNWSVSGPVQMFRRKCFDEIGGYLVLRGGIDAAAEVMARMQGWQVRAFPELSALHHRQTGKENHSRLGIFFHRGLEDYKLGYHPLFFVGRSLLRVRESPWIIGGLTMLGGFLWAALTGAKKKVPNDFIRFLRKEQKARMVRIFRRRTEVAG